MRHLLPFRGVGTEASRVASEPQTRRLSASDFLKGERRSADWSGRWDSNPRPQPWQGCALPLSYARILSRMAGEPAGPGQCRRNEAVYARSQRDWQEPGGKKVGRLSGSPGIRGFSSAPPGARRRPIRRTASPRPPTAPSRPFRQPVRIRGARDHPRSALSTPPAIRSRPGRRPRQIRDPRRPFHPTRPTPLPCAPGAPSGSARLLRSARIAIRNEKHTQLGGPLRPRGEQFRWSDPVSACSCWRPPSASARLRRQR